VEEARGEAASGVEPGALLGGKYRVVRKLGEGGMGTVLLAHHEELDKSVAIKVLAPDLVTDAEVVARFTREARAAAKLHSDHVVRVTDVGRFEGVGPYMVMEYLQGQDLGQLVEQRGPLPIVEAVDYLLEALDAIAEAHAAGIVHRDLKPANLFVATRPDGSKIVKVLDFGISKMEPAAGSATRLTATRSSGIMGSPAYMSPEQLRSAKDVDARADLWSLGVVLYELVTGQLPFDGNTVSALFANILERPPRPARLVRPEIPEPLDAVLMRCLRREPSERFRDVAELGAALAPFGSAGAARPPERAAALLRGPGVVTDPSLAPTHFRPVAPSVPGGPNTQGNWGANQAPRASSASRVAVLLAVAAVLVVLLLAGGLVLLRRGSARVAATASAPPATASAAVAAADTSPAFASAAPSSPTGSPSEVPAPVAGASTAASAPTGMAPVTTTAPARAAPRRASPLPGPPPAVNLDSRH
jgi:serine/threonine-protein kinase